MKNTVRLTLEKGSDFKSDSEKIIQYIGYEFGTKAAVSSEAENILLCDVEQDGVAVRRFFEALCERMPHCTVTLTTEEEKGSLIYHITSDTTVLENQEPDDYSEPAP